MATRHAAHPSQDQVRWGIPDTKHVAAAQAQCSQTPPNTVTPRAVVFDLGEVLATPIRLYERFASVLVRSPKDVEAAYWASRDTYDRGGSAEAFWSSVIRGLGNVTHGSVIEELMRIDTEAWTTIRPDAMLLLRDLASKGLRVGILSNATREMALAARQTRWADYVTDWFFSAELQVAKPDPDLFHHVTVELGLSGRSIVFFDDREINVKAALESSGWNAHLWTSGEQTRTLLHDLGML